MLLIRVTFRDTARVEAPRALLHFKLFIIHQSITHPHHFINSTWCRTSFPASRDFTPCTIKEGEIGQQKGHPDLQHYALNFFENSVRNLWTTWTTFHDILAKLTPFKTLCSDVYGKMSEIVSFQDPCVLHWNWLISRPVQWTICQII